MAIESMVVEKYRLGNFVSWAGAAGFRAGPVHRYLLENNVDLSGINDKAGTLKYVSDRISNAKAGRGVKPAEVTKKDAASFKKGFTQCEAMLEAEKLATREARKAEREAAAAAKADSTDSE